LRFFGGFFSGSWVEFLEELLSLPLTERGGVRILSLGDIAASPSPKSEMKLSSDAERRESAGLKLGWFMFMASTSQVR